MSLNGLVAALLGVLLGTGLPMRLAAWLTPRAGATEHVGLRYGPGERGLLDLTLPARTEAGTPLVVFFHGGGWYSGSRRDYAFLARALAAEGVAVAMPDYRLWPAGRWPEFVQDGAAAVAWLRGEAGRAAGAPTGPLVLMGHSAGGFIAAALALDPRWLAEAGLPGGRAALAGAAPVSAPISWQPDEEPTRAIFADAPGGRIAAVPDPAALPGTPPMLLIHGTADTVVGPFHSEDLARDLAAAGVPVTLHWIEGAGHVAPMVALAEPARRWGWVDPAAWDVLLRFLREQAQGAVPPSAPPA